MTSKELAIYMHSRAAGKIKECCAENVEEFKLFREMDNRWGQVYDFEVVSFNGDVLLSTTARGEIHVRTVMEWLKLQAPWQRCSLVHGTTIMDPLRPIAQYFTPHSQNRLTVVTKPAGRFMRRLRPRIP